MADRSPIPAALSLDGLAAADARSAFALAADAGYRGIAFATNHRELNPESLGESARRHLRTILAAKRLQIDSLRAASPKGGLADSRTIDATLTSAHQALTLARELSVRTVSLHLGPLAEPTAGNLSPLPTAVSESTLISALRELAQQADASGLTLALSANSTPALARLLKAVDFDGAKINLDGARSIAAAEDPLQTAGNFGDRIAQFTASDAVRSGSSVRVAMLGEGQLPLLELNEILQEQGFRGPLVVDVRDLPDGPAAARHAAEVLRRLFSP